VDSGQLREFSRSHIAYQAIYYFTEVPSSSDRSPPLDEHPESRSMSLLISLGSRKDVGLGSSGSLSKLAVDGDRYAGVSIIQLLGQR